MVKKIHTSMRGVQLNMEEMRAKNEGAVALTGYGSKLRMNANGDTLAKGGLIDKRREVIDQEYATTLQGNVKQLGNKPVVVDTFETPSQVVERLSKPKQEPKVEPKAEAKAEPKQDALFDEATDSTPPVAQRPARKLIERED